MLSGLMVTLAALMGQMADDGGDLLVEAPESWSQGRTLYGGITAALCHEAARLVTEAPPPLRSAQIAFIGPAGGTLKLQPKLLRQGRSTRMFEVDCIAGDAIAARAIFAFGAARETRVVHDRLSMPAVPAPDDSPNFIRPRDPPPRGFIANFDLRLAAGANTYTPGADPDLLVWVRHRDAAGVDPTTALLALADCLPPAAMVAFPERGLISTMTWTVDFARAPASGEGWHLLRSSSQQSGDGYSLQDMALWDSSGTFVAAGRQVIAIFV
jgi:acyl-CoA thioesterase